jgi:peptidase M28-like protein
MEAIETVRALTGFTHRGPGTDAERRAALWLARSLRDGGREAELDTVWVRPQWAWVYALHAALAVVGSVLLVSVPVAGLVVLALTLVSLWLDLAARLPVLRLLMRRRATQNVRAPAPPRARDAPPPAVRLIVTAHYDAGRSGLVYRDGLRRAANRVFRGHAPSPVTVLLGAVAVLTIVAALRVAGVAETPLRIVQLAASIVLLFALALLLDVALSQPGPAANADASAVAVALALTEALDRDPPRHLAVDVVLAGAGEGPALGMRSQVRRMRRRRLKRQDAVVLELRPCGRGRPRYWTRDGLGLPLRLHPRLVELADRVAEEESHLEAARHRGASTSAAYVARAGGYPAIAIGCLDADGLAPGSHQHTDVPDEVDPGAMTAALELCLGLVDRLDADVGSRRQR